MHELDNSIETLNSVRKALNRDLLLINNKLNILEMRRFGDNNDTQYIISQNSLIYMNEISTLLYEKYDNNIFVLSKKNLLLPFNIKFSTPIKRYNDTLVITRKSLLKLPRFFIFRIAMNTLLISIFFYLCCILIYTFGCCI
jgi:hypothetical protein